jgi:hypothetical protein
MNLDNGLWNLQHCLWLGTHNIFAAFFPLGLLAWGMNQSTRRTTIVGVHDPIRMVDSMNLPYEKSAY